MYEPSDLYRLYSENPCNGDVGAGAPYSLSDLTIFLKQIKYPCLKNVRGYDSLASNPQYDGSGKLALPYKFLEIFDTQLFSEIQPSIEAGVAHAIRNAADVSRACSLVELENNVNPVDGIKYYGKITKRSLLEWRARGATEHMTFFGNNSITKCLFVLGPDLVPQNKASNRATGCGDMDCLPPWKNGQQISSLGAATFSCKEDDSGGKECSPCKKCPPDDDTDICCQPLSCEDRAQLCCGDPISDGTDFIYNVPAGNDIFSKVKSDRIPDGTNQENYGIFHIGFLTRKHYEGYANLEDSSNIFHTCPTDLFLKYAQENNGYDYINNLSEITSNKIQRVKTITYVDNITDIKRLIYNGYGIVLLSNIGFSKHKDSYGLAYPDKIWYHTYAIVGYDDTKKHFNECVYVLANSWGDWNTGGHPPWGKLPTGCFLVTETHLKGMINLERTDKIGCRDTKELFLAADGERYIDVPGCILDNDCVPWTCDTKQTPLGMAFLICFEDHLERRHFDYKKMHEIAQYDYTYGQEKNILVSELNSLSDANIFYDNISGTLNISAYTTPTTQMITPSLVKKGKLFVVNEEDQDPKKYIEFLELQYQSELSNLNLDFPINDNPNVRYIKNEIEHYNSLFNKKSYLFEESTSVIGSDLKIKGSEIYIDNIYGPKVTISSSTIFFNNLKGGEVIISGVSTIDRASPEIKQSVIDCESLLIIDSKLTTTFEKVFISGSANNTIIANQLIINASKYVEVIDSNTHEGIEINSPLIFYGDANNSSSVNGNVFFLYGSNNLKKGVCNGTTIFADNIPGVTLPNNQEVTGGSSLNNGSVYGTAFFKSSMHNDDAHIYGDCIADTQSDINGDVTGQLKIQKSVIETSPPKLTPR